MYYLYRKSPTHKWNIAKEPPEGSESHQHSSWADAEGARSSLNAIIDNEREQAALTKPKGKSGRPWPKDHKKITRVSFTLPATIVDQIPGDGSPKTVSAFCKAAIINQLTDGLPSQNEEP